MSSDATFGVWIVRIRTALRREFEARAEPLGITVAQSRILRCLWQSDGALTSELTSAASLDSGTITGVLDRLEARNLVRRERSSSDRRTVRIYLTAEGREMERPVMQIIREVNDEALKGLDPHERVALTSALERVASNLGSRP